MTGPRAPRLARWLLAVTAPRHRRDAVLGDLAEEFVERCGRPGATLWYWRQALGSAGPLLLSRITHHVRRALRAGEGRAAATGTSEPGDGIMAQLLQDLHFGLRKLRKSLAFTAVVVLTLALGIGANTVIYGVVDGVILHPYPFPEPDALVAVGTQYPKLGATDVTFIEHMSPAEYMDIRDQAGTLERVVAWDMGNRQVSFGDVTENLFTGFWWGNAFETLEVRPFLGRGMTPEETVGGDAVAVLSHRVWETRFGADRSLVGGTIQMNGSPYTVVGIMPPRTTLHGMDLWIPMGVSPDVFPRERRQFQIIARTADGADLDAVNAELEGLARRTETAWGAEFEEYEGWRMEADTWTDANVRTLKPAAFILLGAVGFVLLLVCSNVASLLLSRSGTRRREVAVRTALGAGRSRIVAQLLTESVALSAVGGVVGVGLAWYGTRIVADLLATVPFLAGTVELNPRVLLFTAGVSVLAGVLFGLFPALQMARPDIQGTLAAEGAGTTLSRARNRLQRVMVGVEVALALVLLTGGGLFLNSLIRLNTVDTGFRPEGVLSMRLTLPWEEYDGPAINAFFQELEERVGGLPGVTSVGVGSQFPPVAFSRERLMTEGMSVTDEGQLPVAMATLVSPGYFAALGIPLLRGRSFTELDVENTPMVAVLNEAAAALLFPGEEALGGRVRTGPEDPWIEVVGIVGNTLNQGLDAPTSPEVFASHRQVPGWSNQLFVLVRTQGEPRSVLPAVREQIRALDADQPVYGIRTVEEALAAGTASHRIAASALGGFALFALLLAAIGIYSVVSSSVGQRTREIGLRMALGADAPRLRRLVVRQALAPVVAGAAVGLAVALGLGRLLDGLLFQVTGKDPLTLGGTTALFLAVAALASFVPALRASRLDPARTLREE